MFYNDKKQDRVNNIGKACESMANRLVRPIDVCFHAWLE